MAKPGFSNWGVRRKGGGGSGEQCVYFRGSLRCNVFKKRLKRKRVFTSNPNYAEKATTTTTDNGNFGCEGEKATFGVANVPPPQVPPLNVVIFLDVSVLGTLRSYNTELLGL